MNLMQNLTKILLPRQLLLLLILSTGLLNHVILILNLLTAAGRDSWLSVIVAYPISSGFLQPLVVLFGIFIAISNTTLKDPSFLFPVMFPNRN
ncbi:hypothetical protein V7659_13505 [Neobacillus drentensis]|uniref:hypothetical protein n=1 Tax=Neobacillus drentensis TaxID=220684 RepID=UPI0030003ECC